MLAIRSGDTAENPTPKILVGGDAEPAFDLVEPARGCRGEVQVEPLVPVEPPLHFGVLVSGVVVQDQMNPEAFGHFPVDGAQERQELLVPMPRQALADHLARLSMPTED